MALGYSLSASDSSSVASDGKQQTGSGTGYRGAQVSLATGAGATASADGSASDLPPWLMYAVLGGLAYLVVKKKG